MTPAALTDEQAAAFSLLRARLLATPGIVETPNVGGEPGGHAEEGHPICADDLVDAQVRDALDTLAAAGWVEERGGLCVVRAGAAYAYRAWRLRAGATTP